MHKIETQNIAHLIGNVIGDNQLIASMTAQSRLLGAIPELDSIAIVNLIIALEKRYGFQIHDDEVEESIFITLGSLQAFVQQKVNGCPSADPIVKSI